MIKYTWSILEVFAKSELLDEVKFLLTADDGDNTVKTEGYHQFSEGLVSKPLSEIKESDLIGWLESDIIKDGVNAIKLNLQNQLETLKTSNKIGFPWEAETFTIG